MTELYRSKTTLEQWRMLQAVVDYGGYAQAAAKLNKSQSSLNHAVAKLQHQLGVQLLEVKGRKAHLTHTGEVLLRRSRQLTEVAQTLEELAQHIDCGWEPEIRISVEILYPKAQLLEVLKAFHPQSRGSRLQIIDSVITGSEELINAKAVDIAITGHVPRGFLSESLLTVEMQPVVHRDHPLAQLGRPISQDELAQTLQLVIRDTGQKPREDRGWLKAENRWTFTHFMDAIQTLKAGLGFAWLPLDLIREELAAGELVTLALQQGGARLIPLHLVIPEPDRCGPGTRMLAELIRRAHGLTTAEAPAPDLPKAPD
ncbi:LysR family transcriptional regulator [Gallaecimonas sp. GXIMD4217]|uniref:LysR family transcriptional regulator n=1 Tax=Gallaecimonas sp. GXIMD4217 TaxID=3131927 RepID=UPI00311AF693